MAGATDNRKMGSRILLGAVVMLLGGSMLLYLVPTTPGTGEISTDTVAKIGDQSVSLQEVREKVNEYERQRQIPKFFESRLALEILQQLVFQKEIEYEAKRLGITVSDSSCLRPSMAAPSLVWIAMRRKCRHGSNCPSRSSKN